MAHSIELLLADDGERAVRAQWVALLDAGLPSAGRLQVPTNRPHVTLLAGRAVDPAADAALKPLVGALPLPAVLGAPLVFPQGGRFTLVRALVVDAALLDFHCQVHGAAAGFVTGLGVHLQPGRWTPHVTLARRLTAAQVASALGVLDWTSIETELTGLRRWNSDERTDYFL